MSVLQVAVLMTSHNRRETTLHCLDTLHRQQGLEGRAELAVHLVDAGSTDGTAAAVRAADATATVVEVGPDVYWGQGTALAARSAAGGYSHHLWLNDDVALAPDAVARLLDTATTCDDCGTGTVVVGQLVDRNGRPSYGGFRRGRRPLAFERIGPRDAPTTCDTLNGNVVLVPKAVVDAVGTIDPAFPHVMGDIDFGLRAGARGFRIVQAGGLVGTCDNNPPTVDLGGPLVRLRAVRSVKRLPVRPWWVFCRRHAGVAAPLYFVKPYAVAVLGGRSGSRSSAAERP